MGKANPGFSQELAVNGNFLSVTFKRRVRFDRYLDGSVGAPERQFRFVPAFRHCWTYLYFAAN
ncbi:hypothetical protein BF95_09110 [Sphingobium sp. Ant17]|nr:hypothetical protein BF95_09110 [Sphingobium sp. Ant17]